MNRSNVRVSEVEGGTGERSPLIVHDRQLRRDLLQEVKYVFEEYSRKDFPNRLECMEDELHCSQRNFCMNAMIRGVEAASMAFINGDSKRTMDILDDMEDEMERGSEECRVDDCRDYALSMLSEVRTVFSLAMRITDRLETGSEPEMLCHFDSEEIAENLKPLSHPNRLSILHLLKDGTLSFSTLSSELGLRTGHLQFHLKSLGEGGYVRKGEQRGMYEITLRGITALEGLQAFMTNRVGLD